MKVMLSKKKIHLFTFNGISCVVSVMFNHTLVTLQLKLVF